MITTHKIPYRDGELRLGWASWDNGSLTDRSIKYAYPDRSGKISRGSPELPFDILLDMVEYAYEQGELQPYLHTAEREALNLSDATPDELIEERRKLSICLTKLQGLMMMVPSAHWQPIYDEIGARYDAVKQVLAGRG